MIRFMTLKNSSSCCVGRYKSYRGETSEMANDRRVMTITVTVAVAGHGSGGGAQWSDLGYILEVQLSALATGFNVRGGEMRRIDNNAQALGLSPQTG